MLPATKAVPKELLPVYDRPLIQHIVEEALASGIEELIFVTRPDRSPVVNHFMPDAALTEKLQDEPELLESLNIATLAAPRLHFVTQHEPLGLGHAILQAEKLVGSEPFAVLLPDELFLSVRPCLSQLLSAYREHGGPVVGLKRVEDEEVQRYGIAAIADVQADDTHSAAGGQDRKSLRLSGLIEKPALHLAPSNCAIIGRYVLEPGIFDALKFTAPGAGGEIQLTDALASRMGSSSGLGQLVDGERFDCGTRFGWLDAQIAFAKRDQAEDLIHRGLTRNSRASARDRLLVE